jgi:tetratricopeptide (TPR) repeat protein
MKETNMTPRAFFLMLLYLTGGISPVAAQGFKPNAAELLRLPPYCQAKFNLPQGSAASNAWRDQIGENYKDLHHYCAGLNYVNRYWGEQDPRQRSYYLQRALGNFDYMVKAEKPGFALRAELYLNRGEVFRIMRKPGQAIDDFKRALSINPNLEKPYLQLADLHKAGKSTARALETVTEGLRHIPDSKPLQRRYLELGGKKPFPEPIVAKVDEPAPEPAAAPAGAADASSEPTPAGDAPGSEPVVTTESPPIGNSKNPVLPLLSARVTVVVQRWM